MSSMGGAMMALWMLWPVVIKGLKCVHCVRFFSCSSH